jgi:hypothetical protein
MSCVETDALYLQTHQNNHNTGEVGAKHNLQHPVNQDRCVPGFRVPGVPGAVQLSAAWCSTGLVKPSNFYEAALPGVYPPRWSCWHADLPLL